MTPHPLIALDFVEQLCATKVIDCIIFCLSASSNHIHWLHWLLFCHLGATTVNACIVFCFTSLVPHPFDCIACLSVLCHHIYRLHYLLCIILVPPQPLIALRFALQLSASTALIALFFFPSFVTPHPQIALPFVLQLGKTTSPNYIAFVSLARCHHNACLLFYQLGAITAPDCIVFWFTSFISF